jgi:hypothetical protein
MMQMSAVENSSKSWTTRKSPKMSTSQGRNETHLNQDTPTSKTGPMITRISAKIGTNTTMIVGKTIKNCHDMTAEMAIATVTLADAMTSPLQNNRSGV